MAQTLGRIHTLGQRGDQRDAHPVFSGVAVRGIAGQVTAGQQGQILLPVGLARKTFFVLHGTRPQVECRLWPRQIHDRFEDRPNGREFFLVQVAILGRVPIDMLDSGKLRAPSSTNLCLS